MVSRAAEVLRLEVVVVENWQRSVRWMVKLQFTGMVLVSVCGMGLQCAGCRYPL
jgi:hypothetical protein